MVEVEFWLPSSAEEGRAQTRECAGVVGVVAIPLTIRPFHDLSDQPAAALSTFGEKTRRAANGCRGSLCLVFHVRLPHKSPPWEGVKA
jgi:hypothetical protein